MRKLIVLIALFSSSLAMANLGDSRASGMSSVLQSEALKSFMNRESVPVIGIRYYHSITMDVARYFQVDFQLKYTDCFVIASVDGFDGPGDVQLQGSNCQQRKQADQNIEERVKKECRDPEVDAKLDAFSKSVESGEKTNYSRDDIEELQRNTKQYLDDILACTKEVIKEELAKELASVQN